MSATKQLTANAVRRRGIICYNTVRFSCRRNRDFLLMKTHIAGPVIRFMRENIAQLDGDINSSNIRCRRCTTRQSGGFDPDYGIRICANEMRNRGHLEDTMAHEMVHAYDHLRFKTEWRDNLRHAACTEVRQYGSMILIVREILRPVPRRYEPLH